MCCLGQCFKGRVPWMFGVPRSEIKCSAIPALFVNTFPPVSLLCHCCWYWNNVYANRVTTLLFRVFFFSYCFSNSDFRPVLIFRDDGVRPGCGVPCYTSWSNCHISFQQQRRHSLTYFAYFILTYLLTPWSRILLEKLIRSQLVQKFPAFYGTRRFIAAFTSAHHLSSNLRLGLPSGLFPLGFLTKILYTPVLNAFLSIWSPEQYWVSSTDQEAPHYVVFSAPLLPRPT